MLAAADAEIVRRDPALGGLAVVLDADAFAAELRLRLGVNPTAASAVYVRYKAGTSCLVAYRVRLDGRWIPAYAKTFRECRRDKLDKRRRFAAAGAWAVVDDPPMSIGLFPVDAKLPALPILADQLKRFTLLERLAPTGCAGRVTEVAALAYKPERRFVGKLLVDGVACGVVKLYTRFEYARAHSASKLLRKAQPLVPAVIGRWRRQGAISFGWIEGERLDRIIRFGGGAEAVRQCGAALALLHRADHELDHARDTEAFKVKAAAEAIASLWPPFDANARRIAESVVAALPASHAIVPTHGDFYARQVLVRPAGTVAIIDLDEAGLRDPVSDLANFLAHLELDAIAGRLHSGQVGSLAEAFLGGYHETSRLPPAEFDVHLAGALLRLAPHFFRERDPEWPARIGAVVERAGQLLDGAGRSRRSPLRQAAAAERPGDALRTLASALDTDRVQKAFASLPSLGAAGSWSIRSATLIRHKSGRRCLIAYELDRADGPPLRVLGKIHRKGADRRSYEIQSALRRCGFDDVAADGVSVPEPLGVVPTLDMWLQRWVAGEAAAGRLQSQPDRSLAVRIARAIHKLHSSPLRTARSHTMDDELRILNDRLAKVAACRPEWRKRLERLALGCIQAGASLPTVDAVPIHRDFYPDHVLVDGERLYLIDFDLCAAGDPALDAGNFVGHLIELAIRQAASRPVLEQAAAIFTTEFGRLSGPDSTARVDTYATLTLARHVYIATQVADRQQYSDELLELCEQRLAGTAPGARPQEDLSCASSRPFA